MTTTSVIMPASVVSGGCGALQLPPPQAPTRQLPRVAVEPGPVTAGLGRVVIDVVDGPSRVEEVTGRSEGFATTGSVSAWSSAVSTRPVCTSPCVADFSYGAHELRLTLNSEGDATRTSIATVTVGGRASVFRHALGQHTEHVGGWLGGLLSLSIGISGALIGPVLLLIDTGVGIVTTLAGVALGVFGAVLMGFNRTELQDGSSTQWTPDGPLYQPG